MNAMYFTRARGGSGGTSGTGRTSATPTRGSGTATGAGGETGGPAADEPARPVDLEVTVSTPGAVAAAPPESAYGSEPRTAQRDDEYVILYSDDLSTGLRNSRTGETRSVPSSQLSDYRIVPGEPETEVPAELADAKRPADGHEGRIEEVGTVSTEE